jgi:RNA polymerase sigma-70 factor (ECF subfamily)
MTTEERRECLATLVLCHTALDPEQITLFREVFSDLVAAHREQVWKRLERRGLGHAAEDIYQQTFFAFFQWVVAKGFPFDISAALASITYNRLIDHVRRTKRKPESVGICSSVPPISPPDVDRGLDIRELLLKYLPMLSEEHWEVLDACVIARLSHADAAQALGLPLGTIKSRLMAAKKRLYGLLAPVLPPSQR